MVKYCLISLPWIQYGVSSRLVSRVYCDTSTNLWFIWHLCYYFPVSTTKGTLFHVNVKWVKLFSARLQIFTPLCHFYWWATAMPEEVFSCLDLPAHLLLFCLHKTITHKHKEPKSIQLQLTQTFIIMMDGPPPWRMHLSTLLIRFHTISKVTAFS